MKVIIFAVKAFLKLIFRSHLAFYIPAANRNAPGNHIVSSNIFPDFYTIFFQAVKKIVPAFYITIGCEFINFSFTACCTSPIVKNIDYSEKLTEIIANNDIKEVTIVRMEVPCCGGLEQAAKNALQASGKFIPWQVVTVSRDGKILD